MRVEIGLGTTQAIAAVVGRGNYAVDEIAPGGAVAVTLTTQPAGFQRTFRLERRAAAAW
ncbi:hypothetical protein [Mycobacterium sp.]|uniref:hypothetical protein n=1 Tax=Mycobacterium sp. TaxID=1785 RepID=UPI0031D80A75